MASQSVLMPSRPRCTSTERPSQARRISLVIPERFKDGDDAQDDVTAPRTKIGNLINQSFVSMIANVGSIANHNPSSGLQTQRTVSPLQRDGLTSIGRGQNARSTSAVNPSASRSQSAQAVFRSTPMLKKPAPRLKHLSSIGQDLSASQILPPMPARAGSQETTRIVSEREEVDVPEDVESSEASEQSPEEKPETSGSQDRLLDADLSPESELDHKLAAIFETGKTEKILADFPCGLLQNVLLQGRMYITRRHICFFAYLPNTSQNIAKAGYLYKKGRTTPGQHRFWFVLKSNVLSYHTDASNVYFVNGTIDLSSVTAVEYVEDAASSQTYAFTITTTDRQYRLQAETENSAKQWVEQLHGAVYRSQHPSHAVKIALPVDNILDVDSHPVLKFTDTMRIRIVDNDETFAIDEYFFSFPNFSQTALQILRPLIEHNPVSMQKTNNSASTSSRPNEELLDHASPSSQVVLSRRDREESILQAISQSVMIDAGTTATDETSPRGQRLEAQRRALPSRENPRTPRKEAQLQSETAQFHQESRPRLAQLQLAHTTTPLDEPEDLLSSNASSNSSIADSHNVDPLSASQILQGSGVFYQAQVSPHPSQRILSNSRSTVSKQASVSREGTQTDRSSTDLDSPSSFQSSEDHRDVNATVSQKRLVPPPQLQTSSSSSTLQDLMRRGAYPIQKASGFAGIFRTQSKRVSDLLAIESKGYYTKISGMWSGKKMHYDDGEALTSSEVDDQKRIDDGDRFRMHFALPQSERLRAAYHAWLYRTVPVYGKLYVGERRLCFRGLVMGQRTKMILPFRDIENIDNENGFRFGYSGLVIIIRGHEELFFEFARPDARNDCTNTLLRALEAAKDLQQSSVLLREQASDAEFAKTERDALDQARRNSMRGRESLSDMCSNAPASPILFEGPLASVIDFKPPQPLNITCLTIGSRGDVQPYIALCKGLLDEGHHPRIVTHAEFGPWIRHHGIDFAPIAGDPAEIMRLCVEHDMFTVSFLREAASSFRGWIDQLLSSSWKACQGTDLLIESPSAMAGVHIAEALRIPYFRAFTMPWTRTRAYPHAFAVPSQKLGGNYNTFTYVMFDNVFWQATASQINRWRSKTLGLPPTSLDKIQASKIPFLYNFSPSVVAPPLDFNQWIRVTGYWFLDEGDHYDPPSELTTFIEKAKSDNKKIVYIGFGSIVVEDPRAMTKTVVDSVSRADVRCILSKGWSDRLASDVDATKPEFPLPPEIFLIRSAPHDWLFQHIDAAVHHGGAGTTGASLRAGLPTIVKPFFGDQFFFGSRVEDLGVGRCLKKVNTSVFARALWEVTNSRRIIDKARQLGEQIRSEDGVGTAIQAIYRDLEYARTLIKRHPSDAGGSAEEEVTEDWTLVGNDSDND